MAKIQLLSTDFDGTLIGHPSDGRCVPPLADALAAFCAGGGFWAINTGRTLAHAVEGIQQFRAPVEPQFLLTNERDVYRRSASGNWEEFGDWNVLCRERHDRLFRDDTGIFNAIRQAVSPIDGVGIIEEDGVMAGLISRNEEIMDTAVAALGGVIPEHPDFMWQRNTIYLRFCHRDYHKGAALGELSRLLKVGRDAVMAMGDHHNDLSMLCGKFAAHVACPANAIPEVKKSVRNASGYVARTDFGEGVAESLRALGAV